MEPTGGGPILVSGASGFVGSAVTEYLLSHGRPVHALIHNKMLTPRLGLTCFRGDLLDPAVLDKAIAGCRAVIHLVGIIRQIPSKGVTFQRLHVQGAQAVVQAAVRNKVRRFVHMSALGARLDAPAEYHRTKAQGENCVTSSGLDWTVIRPSLIHGPKGEFLQMEINWARRRAAPFLFMPYFGRGILGLGGSGMVQPVAVGDVARAFCEAVDNPKTICKTYCLGGRDRMTWPQMHRTLAQAVVGHPRATAPIPTWWAKLLTRVTPPSLLPFNRDQVYMAQEDNTCDLAPFAADFGWTPRGFAESIQLE